MKPFYFKFIHLLLGDTVFDLCTVVIYNLIDFFTLQRTRRQRENLKKKTNTHSAF